MHFFWDNRGPKDIIRSLSSDVFEPRTSTGSEPFSILNCLDATKFVSRLRVFTLIETICANICLKSQLKSANVHARLTCVSQKRRSLNSLITGLIDGRTDEWMGRLTPNFFRVVQILLDIAVKVSLKKLLSSSKGSRLLADIARFCFGTELNIVSYHADLHFK